MLKIVNTQKLREKILEKGLTNQGLAEKIEVDRKTISNLMTGKNNPSYTLIVCCCDALNLTPNEISEIFFADEDICALSY